MIKRITTIDLKQVIYMWTRSLVTAPDHFIWGKSFM